MLVPEEVQTFLAVVRAGSFLQGAKVMQTTQPTASQRIASLENRLGRRLLLRSRGNRNVTLTTDGENFLQIAAKWERLLIETQDLQREGEMRLEVGAVHVLTHYLLPPLHRRLATIGDGLKLRISTGTGPELERKIAHGHLQTAFTVFQNEHVELQSIALMSAEMKVVMKGSSDTPAPGGTLNLSTLDLRKEIGQPWGTRHNLWRRDQGLEALEQMRRRTDTILVLPSLLQAPGSWAFVPEFVVPELTRGGEFHAFTPDPAPPKQTVYQLLPLGRDLHSTLEMRLLTDLCAELWPNWYS